MLVTCSGRVIHKPDAKNREKKVQCHVLWLSLGIVPLLRMAGPNDQLLFVYANILGQNECINGAILCLTPHRTKNEVYNFV